ncbi:MAG: 3'-5' exonuclease domain-containing protein 2 [Porphyromonadaceae bacterium]|nr:3'-5' exonuclease domain-containing protein 2 [Porphyromonadaceae bacterium]
MIRTMFIPKISKEEVNRMPIEEFEGEIIVIDNSEKADEAFEYLNQQKILGIDTETKPSFKRGVTHKVSLIQVATVDVCFLFRLNKIGFPNGLSELLSNKKIKKIGLALRDDLNGLFKQQNFKPQGFIDLQHEVGNYGILELSLQKMYAIIFGKKISKSQRLSNWERNELTVQQKVYAATDAWATLQIYLKLLKEKKLSKKEIENLAAEFAVENHVK